MAKLSQINRNKKRERLVAQYASKRAALKAIAENMSVPAEERFNARLKLAKLPRNSSMRNGLPSLTGIVTPANGTTATSSP